VLAAADGEVAAAVGSFRTGGRGSKENRARANYVALRHGGGVYSRYYHLCHGGTCVSMGERVVAGQQIGRSGNTGFSGAPHLHWDVVDVLPVETSTLTLLRPKARRADGPEHVELPCVAGAFSAPLPAVDAPLSGPAVVSDPPTLSGPLCNDAAALRGCVLLVERCPHVDFVEKAERAAAAGAAAVIVVNYAKANPAALLTMGLPKASRGKGVCVAIPALFVSADVGKSIKAAIAAAPSHAPPTLLVGRSAHFGSRRERCSASPRLDGGDVLPAAAPPPPAVGASAVEEAHPAQLREVTSDFVPLTLPARFMWPGHPEGYVPSVGERPPRDVQSAGPSPTLVLQGAVPTGQPMPEMLAASEVPL
jgi:hypothetical protein